MAEVTRRNFLRGGVIGAAALGAAALVGCSPSTSESSDKEKGTDGTSTDWLGEKPTLTPEDCESTVEVDVLVVGAALAGSMAAYGAMRNGAKVAVIERNGAAHCGGMEASFVSSKYQLESGIPEYDKIWLANTLMNYMQFRADMSLIAVWCERSGAIFDDLRETVLDPYGAYYEAKSLEGLFPDVKQELCQYVSTGIAFSTTDTMEPFTDTMHQWIEDNGGTIDYHTRAEVLVHDDAGEVVGAIATNADGKNVYYHAAKGVVMCTGSFGANEAMVRHFYPSRYAEWALPKNSYNAYMTKPVDEVMDDGLGHRMLCWEGAQMEEVCSAQSWGIAGYLGFPYLIVNANGERFMNECTSNLISSHIVANQPGENSYVWQIVPTNDFQMPTNFGFTLEFVRDAMHALDGEHYEADTIEGLAEKIQCDPATLKATVDRYNEMCAAGEDTDYLKAKRYLDAVNDPPYVAWKVPYGFFCTTAGVQCDTKLEVLDADGKPIPGLYAAGNTVGYRFGSNYQTLVHGHTNSYAMTHGYIAGESAAKR